MNVPDTLAVLLRPPATVEHPPLAVLQQPPATEASVPVVAALLPITNPPDALILPKNV